MVWGARVERSPEGLDQEAPRKVLSDLVVIEEPYGLTGPLCYFSKQIKHISFVPLTAG